MATRAAAPGSPTGWGVRRSCRSPGGQPGQTPRLFPTPPPFSGMANCELCNRVAMAEKGGGSYDFGVTEVLHALLHQLGEIDESLDAIEQAISARPG